MIFKWHKYILTILLSTAIGCSTLSGLVLKDTTALHALKSQYKEYVYHVSENDSTSEIQKARIRVLEQAEELMSNSDEDSFAYSQAKLINFLSLDNPTEEEYKSLGKIRDVLESAEFQSQPVWFKYATKIVFATYLSRHGNHIIALAMYDSVLNDPEVDDVTKTYALFNYVATAINYSEVNEEEATGLLNRLIGEVKILLDKDPTDTQLLYLEAEIYAQIGDDVQACSYGKSARSVGTNNDKIMNALDFIIETSCTNN